MSGVLSPARRTIAAGDLRPPGRWPATSRITSVRASDQAWSFDASGPSASDPPSHAPMTPWDLWKNRTARREAASSETVTWAEETRSTRSRGSNRLAGARQIQRDGQVATDVVWSKERPVAPSESMASTHHTTVPAASKGPRRPL